MKTCKNHPNRPAYKGRKCEECSKAYFVEQQKKYAVKFHTAFEELNLPNFLHDAKEKILDIEGLSRRYDMSKNSVISYLKKYNIEPRKPYGVSSKSNGRMYRLSIPDMTGMIGTIYPKHF